MAGLQIKIQNVLYIVPRQLIVHRHFSEGVNYIKNTNLSSLKRGTGGRSSFNGIVATVFGSSGFVGAYVCNKLGKIGTQLILPYRGDVYDMRNLKLVGDLGQVLFQPYHLMDEASIFKAVKHSNVVINLVGRDWETKNFTFDQVHVEGARRLAKISKEAGVETFIHVSALNASEHPTEYMLDGGSKFLASKWRGEMAVREEFPEAIVFRPADIYGQEDSFLKYYCSIWRHQGKMMPLYRSGEHTIKQPVFVEDVAAGIVAACKEKHLKGKTYQAVGPTRYKLSELVDWFHRVINKADDWGYYRYDLRFDPLFWLRISLLPKLTLGTYPKGNIHWEKVERECHSDVVVPGIETLEDLGITLTRMEDQVPWELKTYRAYSYYELELSEFHIPKPPQPAAA